MGGSSGADVPAASASNFSTLQNLVKPFIGAGILALPAAFKTGGVLASAILMVILAVGVNFCIRCLLVSVDTVYAREKGIGYDRRTGAFIDSAPAAGGQQHIQQQQQDMDDPSRPLTASTASRSSSDEDVPAGSVDLLALSLHTPSADGGKEPTGANRRGSVSSDGVLHAPVYSFREIGGFAYNRVGTVLVDVNLILSQVGFCIAYMSFISQNLVHVTSALSRVEWVGVLFLIWALLSQIRDIKLLSWTSALGNLVYLVSLGIIFGSGFSGPCCVPPSETVWVRWQGLALVFGTGCFALEGIGLVLPVKRAMKDQGAFGAVLNGGISFVAGLYVLFGVLGYLFYGDAVKSVITDNMGSGPAANAVRVSLSVSLVFTYVIQLFPVSEMADQLWDAKVFRRGAGGEGEKYQALQGDSADAAEYGAAASPRSPAASTAAPKTTWQREVAFIGTRCAIVAFTALISIAVKNFGNIVSLVGSFSNSAIAFILPQLFYIQLVLLPELRALGPVLPGQWWRRHSAFILPWVIIVLGVCASVVGVYTTIDSMVTCTGDDC